MNFRIVPIAMLVALVGCSTGKKGFEEIDPIRSQKLSTNFKSEGITIQTDCSWYTFDKSKCDIIAIESIGTASANGNTDNNRRTALIRAGDQARANVRHFIREEVSSSRVNTVLAKNVELANDRIKSRTKIGETVEMSDQDVGKDTNYSIRENSNNTAYQLTTTIRVNAAGILRGFKVIKQEIVGDQEVAVTIRWDVESDRAAISLQRKFGN
jgi:hypothetical protein